MMRHFETLSLNPSPLTFIPWIRKSPNKKPKIPLMEKFGFSSCCFLLVYSFLACSPHSFPACQPYWLWAVSYQLWAGTCGALSCELWANKACRTYRLWTISYARNATSQPHPHLYVRLFSVTLFLLNCYNMRCLKTSPVLRLPWMMPKTKMLGLAIW